MNPRFIAQVQQITAFPAPYLPEVAFIGRSNTGKSSLINSLVGQRIARTSSTPGRTQGLVFFQIRPNLVFVDFPGFGYAKVSKKTKDDWKELIEHYYENRFTLKGTIWIRDIRRDPDELDQHTSEWLHKKKQPHFIVLTKADQLKEKELESRCQQTAKILNVPEESILPFSSKTKKGTFELWKVIESM